MTLYASSDSFIAALRNQGRALVSLVLTEGANRFAHRSAGLLEELGGILLHVLFFSAVRAFVGAEDHRGMAPIPFLATGIFTYWIFRTTLVNAFNFNAGKPKYAVLPNVTQLDVLMARCIVSGMVFIGMSLSVFVFLFLIGYSNPMAHPWVVLLYLLVSWTWGFSAGLIFAGLFVVVPFARTLLGGSLRFMMYTSGVFYTWSEVPYKFRWFAAGNPFFHLVELLRSAYFPNYHTPIGDPRFVASVTAIGLVLGLLVERYFRPRFETRRNHRPGNTEDDFAFDAF